MALFFVAILLAVFTTLKGYKSKLKAVELVDTQNGARK